MVRRAMLPEKRRGMTGNASGESVGPQPGSARPGRDLTATGRIAWRSVWRTGAPVGWPWRNPRRQRSCPPNRKGVEATPWRLSALAFRPGIGDSSGPTPTWEECVSRLAREECHC